MFLISSFLLLHILILFTEGKEGCPARIWVDTLGDGSTSSTLSHVHTRDLSLHLLSIVVAWEDSSSPLRGSLPIQGKTRYIPLSSRTSSMILSPRLPCLSPPSPLPLYPPSPSPLLFPSCPPHISFLYLLITTVSSRT